MPKYTVTVNYNIKSGSENKVFEILEKEIFALLLDNGCAQIECFQNENNPSHIFYIAHWENLKAAQQIQKKWDEKALLLQKYCTNTPRREFFHLHSSHTEKHRKAA